MKMIKAITFSTLLMGILMASCKKDDVTGVRPTITSTTPINTSIGVVTNTKITATFSVAMNAESLPASFILQQGTTAVPGAVTYAETTATFTPVEVLAESTVYTATITTGAKNTAGASLVKDFVWSFTTGLKSDITIPTVTVTDPLNNATGVTLSKQMVFTFSKPMDPATITVASYILKDGPNTVAGSITYNSATSTATFKPNVGLTQSTLYTATITTTSKDLTGHSLANNFTYGFTTGAQTI